MSRLKLDIASAQRFLIALFQSHYSLKSAKPAFIEIRGKREGEGMSFRRFYPQPERLLQEMGRWQPQLNYWLGVALRRDTQGGAKAHLLALTAAFCDVDYGSGGHKNPSQHQTEAEAQAAIDAFSGPPSLLIHSGGGFQCYWLWRQPVAITPEATKRVEAINRGLAAALGGDLPATDTARILRLPGTYNQKIAGQPRPVRLIWCHPDRLYDLADFAEIEAQGEKARPPAPVAAPGSAPAGEHAAYAQKAFSEELAALARTGEGNRNNQLNKSAKALGELIGAGVLERGAVEAGLLGTALSIGLTEKEAQATIRSGLEAGFQVPRQLPAGRGQRQKPPEPGGSGNNGNPPGPDDQEPRRSYFVGHVYFEEKGRLCLETFDRQGMPQTRPLANFTARITEDICRDDGQQVRREFRLTGRLENGRELPAVQITAKDFDSLNWISREWGAVAAAAPGRTLGPHLCNATRALSQVEGIKRSTVYTHTGWRKIGGVWRYLHGGGALGPGEAVEVDLGENLGLYRLPETGGRDEAQASLRFLDLAAWEVTAPLLAAVFLAPFADVLKIDFSLWIYGPTGSMKSTLAALALCHFGGFDRRTLPGSWFSTVNSLEKLCFTLKDSLVVVDDYMPAANQKESHAMAERAARLLYQAGNRSSRGRLAPDLRARVNHHPRGLIISTGEMLLPGQRQSATARYLGLELDPQKTPIDKDLLTASQKEAHLYAATMAAYLTQVQPQLDARLEVMQDLWESYRGAFRRSTHLRIPEIQAWLAMGFEMFLQFLVSLKTIDQKQADELLNRAWQIFVTLGEKHSRIIEGEKPTLKFLSILTELFLTSRIYAESKSYAGQPPENSEFLGWQGTEPARNAFKVGWADEAMVYLLPETALRIVSEALRAQNDFLQLGRNDLWAALVRETLIIPGADGRTTRVERIQGGSKRVICLPLAHLIPDGGKEPENQQESAAAADRGLF